MTTTTVLETDNRPAVVAATLLEQALDGNIIMSVGEAQPEVLALDALLPASGAVVIACSIAEPTGIVALAISPKLASALKATGGDVLGLAGPALTEAVQALQESSATDLGAGHPMEMPTAELEPADGAHVVLFDILEGGDRLASLIVRIDPPPAPEPAASDVAPHEFQPIDMTRAGEGFGGGRAFDLLSDVEMGVTAELGRKRMTVRELLALTAGSVIELDRAAGSPVDVLVNGTVIARGEVVVIDEEFGIRVSEIVANGFETKRQNG